MFRFSSRKPAQELANVLFTTCILDDLDSIVEKWQKHYSNTAAFEKNIFERHVFVYLAANLAVGLTEEHSRRPTIVNVISHLKPLINNELRRRWGISEGEAYDVIETASLDLAKLVCANSELDRGLAFDWAMQWLARTGIEEFNPITLFKFSYYWKNQYIFFAKLLSELPNDQFTDHS